MAGGAPTTEGTLCGRSFLTRQQGCCLWTFTESTARPFYFLYLWIEYRERGLSRLLFFMRVFKRDLWKFSSHEEMWGVHGLCRKVGRSIMKLKSPALSLFSMLVLPSGHCKANPQISPSRILLYKLFILGPLWARLLETCWKLRILFESCSLYRSDYKLYKSVDQHQSEIIKFIFLWALFWASDVKNKMSQLVATMVFPFACERWCPERDLPKCSTTEER